jgi:hypothetical protein
VNQQLPLFAAEAVGPKGLRYYPAIIPLPVEHGIGWHRDKPQFEEVFGLSLGSACKFRFRRKTGEKWARLTWMPNRARSTS